MSKHRKRHMEAAVFGLALQRLGVDTKARSYEAARLVMVEGRRIADAERINRVKRQSVYEAMDKVEAAFTDLGICPYCGQKMPEV